MASQSSCCFGSRVKFYQGLIEELSAFARGYFELGELQQDGLSLETHLRNYWKQTGQMPEQLDVPDCPVELMYIWSWWCTLNSTRQVSMDVCRITYNEILSWSQLYKISLTPFELDCIVALDSIYMQIRAEQQERRKPSKSSSE